MCPSELYDQMWDQFPPVHPEDHEWENVHDGKTAKVDVISLLLMRYIDAPEVIILVHSDPGIGAVFPIDEAARYIATHIFEGEIQVSDPLFTCFVAISRIGVATGWRQAPPSVQVS